MNTAIVREGEQYCVFYRSNNLFALPASCIAEVAPEPVFAPIPLADPILAGIAHLRNEFLPVIDLAHIADSFQADDSTEQQLIVVTGATGAWALLVDSVVGLERLEPSNHHERNGNDDWSAVFSGSAAVGEQVSRVLNPNAIYRLAEQVLRRNWKMTAADEALSA